MKNIKSNNGGALLLSIIIAFLVSSISAALAMITLNQADIAYGESERIKNIALLEAGVNYAYYLIRTGAIPEQITLNEPFIWQGLEITISRDIDGMSFYRIDVNTAGR